MNKNQQLNELFKKWKNHSKHTKFFNDGIINESKFDNTEPKILFIAKEANDSSKDNSGKDEDYRDWWSNEEDALYDRFTYRVIEWAYGMLNCFPDYDTIWKKVDDTYPNEMNALASIAFMNVKKSGGGSSSKEKDINEYLDHHHELILEQIQIIEPTIILQGLTWESTVNKLYQKGKMEWKATGHGIDVGRFTYKNIDTKVLDFYHPSSQGSAVALYYLLEKVFKCETFRDL